MNVTKYSIPKIIYQRIYLAKKPDKGRRTLLSLSKKSLKRAKKTLLNKRNSYVIIRSQPFYCRVKNIWSSDYSIEINDFRGTRAGCAVSEDSEWTLIHEKPVYTGSFSSDGRFLMTTSGGVARIWSLSSGEQCLIKAVLNTYMSKLQSLNSSFPPEFGINIRELPPMDCHFLHDHDPKKAIFSPDGLNASVLNMAGQVMMWRFIDEQWMQCNVLLRHPPVNRYDFGYIKHMRFSHDSKTFISTGMSIAKLWTVIDGNWTEQATLNLDAESLSTRFCDSKSSSLAIVSKTGTVKSWEFRNDRWRYSYKEDINRESSYPILLAELSHNAKYLVLVNECNLVFFDYSNIYSKKRYFEHSTIVNYYHPTHIFFSDDDTRMIILCNFRLEIYRITHIKVIMELSLYSSCNLVTNTYASFSHSGTQVAITRSNGETDVLKYCKNEETIIVEELNEDVTMIEGKWEHQNTLLHSKCVWHTEFSTDDKKIVTTSSDNTAKIWSLI